MDTCMSLTEVVLAFCSADVYVISKISTGGTANEIHHQFTDAKLRLHHLNAEFKLVAKDEKGQIFLSVPLDEVEYNFKDSHQHELITKDGSKYVLTFLDDDPSNQFITVLSSALNEAKRHKPAIDSKMPPPGVRSSVTLSPGLEPRHQTQAVSDIENLAQSLKHFIRQGDKFHAMQVAAKLAASNTDLSIHVEQHSLNVIPDEEFRLKVHIEDREGSHGLPVPLKVKPSTTIKELKYEMLQYGFPPEVQKWIIGKRLPKDNETLAQCHIKITDSSVFLYLMNAKAAGLTKEECKKKYGNIPGFDIGFENDPVHSRPEGDYVTMHIAAEPDYMTMHATPEPRTIPTYTRQMGLGRGQLTPNPAEGEHIYSQTLPSPGHQNQHPVLNRTTPGRMQTNQSQHIPNGANLFGSMPPSVGSVRQPTRAISQEERIGWTCPGCTYLNVPTRPGCEICATNRPADYEVPANVKLPESERQRLTREQELEQMALQAGGPVQHASTVQQEQDDTAEQKKNDIQLTEWQLDHLLQLNDMWHQIEPKQQEIEDTVRRRPRPQSIPPNIVTGPQQQSTPQQQQQQIPYARSWEEFSASTTEPHSDVDNTHYSTRATPSYY